MKKQGMDIFVQDISIIAFLAAIFASVLLVGSSDSTRVLENYVMLLGMFTGCILSSLNYTPTAIVLVSVQTAAYTIYKVMNFYANGTVIKTTDYFWLVLPAAAVGAMGLFNSTRARTEKENRELRETVEDLVMVDSVTGLYNLRNFYTELLRQICFSNRNNYNITLMIIRLRYEPELRRLLTQKKYEMLMERMAHLVQDCIRVEDRLFSINSTGGMALIMNCNNEGAAIMKERIKSKISEKSSFDDIENIQLRVDIQIAFSQYDPSMGNDVIAFKQSVEKDLRYDV